MTVNIKFVDLRIAVLGVGRKLPYSDCPVKIKCPVHNDDTDSLAVYPDHITCYGCSFKIQKRMDALAWILHLPDYKAALAVAEKYYATEITVEEKSVPPPSEAQCSIYEGILWGRESHRLDWLRNRGLTDQTIRSFRLGHTGAQFVIPVFDHLYRLKTFRFRRDDYYGTSWPIYDENLEIIKNFKIAKFTGVPGLNEKMIYPEWKIANDYREYLYIVEGELDAILLWQKGLPTGSITNGAGSMSSILTLIPRRIKRCDILGDMDERGRQAAYDLRREASATQYETTLTEWPLDHGKDVTELYQNGKELQD